MSRSKQLIKNFFAYGFAEAISKIMPFLCLPIITRMMPDTAAFGVFNLFTIVNGIGVALIVLSLNTVIFREYFERDDRQYKCDVTTTAQRIVFYNSIFISLVLIVFNQFFSQLFFNDTQYSIVIVFSGISVFLTSNEYLIEAPTKLQNQRRTYIYSKILSSCGYYAILLLLIYLGFTYYSIIFTSIFTALLLIVYFWIKNHHFFLCGKFDKVIAKNLLKIGIPLLPASIMYWVYSAISTIMISRFLDLSELGIYSFGLKIARIGHVLTAVLMGGLTHFIFSSMKDRDYSVLMGKLFETMLVFTTICYLTIFLLKGVIFQLLFTGDYLQGIVVFPYLLFVPLLGFLKYIFLTQFTVIKKPIYHFVFIFIDCLALTALSYFLISDHGIVGVAIANVCASFISFLLLLILVVLKMKLINLSKYTYLLISIFTLVFSMINYLKAGIVSNIVIFSYLGIVSLLYYKRVLKFIGSFKDR